MLRTREMEKNGNTGYSPTQTKVKVKRHKYNRALGQGSHELLNETQRSDEWTLAQILALHEFES